MFSHPDSEEKTALRKPEVNDTYRQFAADALEFLLKQQEICKQTYHIGQYEKWFYDQETGLLMFKNGGIPKVEIKYQEVGSVSRISDTWLWAWDNPHLIPSIYKEMFAVREYGKTMGYERLTKRKWYADQVDGWEMTAIAAYILKALGAYRIPTEKTWTFVVFMEINLVNNGFSE